MVRRVVPGELETRREGGAGPLRNRQMLDEVPDLVLAFHAEMQSSKGTKDCVLEANRRGIKWRVVTR